MSRENKAQREVIPLPEKYDRAIVDQEAQEEAAQDYLRLKFDAEEETTLTGKRLRHNSK